MKETECAVCECGEQQRSLAPELALDSPVVESVESAWKPRRKAMAASPPAANAPSGLDDPSAKTSPPEGAVGSPSRGGGQTSCDAGRRRFGRDVLVVTTGIAIGQTLNVVAAPLLSRLYTPEQMGVLGLLIGMSGVLTPVSTMRYEQAIVLPESDHDASVVGALCLVISVAVAAVTAVAITGWGKELALLLHAPQMTSWLWAVPLMVTVIAAFQVLQAWQSRQRQFHTVARARVSRSGVMVTVQVLAGWRLAGRTWGLLAGFLAGLVAEVGVLAARPKSPPPDFRAALRLGELKRQARRYWKFPGLTVIAGFSPELITFLLAAFFDPVTVGLFWMGHRLLTLPISLLGQSVGMVFYERLSRIAHQTDQSARLIADVFTGQFLLGVLPMATLAVAGPWLFGLAFGAQWEEAGRFARAMVPGYMMLLCAFPIIRTAFVYERQAAIFLWQALNFLTSASTLTLGKTLGGPLGAVFAYSIGQFCVYGLIVFLAFRWAGVPPKSIPGLLIGGLVRGFQTHTEMLGRLTRAASRQDRGSACGRPTREVRNPEREESTQTRRSPCSCCQKGPPRQ